MPFNRDLALEDLKTTIAALPSIKSCHRGGVTREEFGVGEFSFASIVNPVDTKEQLGPNKVKVLITPTIEVHTVDLTASQMELLYEEVWEGILNDTNRSGSAATTIIGPYDPIDYLTSVQGFTLDVTLVVFQTINPVA